MSAIYVDRAVGPGPSPIPVARGNPHHSSLCLLNACPAPPGVSVRCRVFSPMSQVHSEGDKPDKKHKPVCEAPKPVFQ